MLLPAPVHTQAGGLVVQLPTSPRPATATNGPASPTSPKSPAHGGRPSLPQSASPRHHPARAPSAPVPPSPPPHDATSAAPSPSPSPSAVPQSHVAAAHHPSPHPRHHQHDQQDAPQDTIHWAKGCLPPHASAGRHSARPASKSPYVRLRLSLLPGRKEGVRSTTHTSTGVTWGAG